MSQISHSSTFRQELGQRWQSVFYDCRWMLHILLWVSELFILHLFGRETYGNLPTGLFCLIFICGIVGTYIFILGIIPFARYRRTISALVLPVILSGIVWSVLLFWLGTRYYRSHPDITLPLPTPNDYGQFVGYVLISFYLTVWLFCAVYYFIELYDQQKNLKRYQNVLSDKLRAEMTLLQAQVNPHFLFNTLNNIYLLTLKKRNDASVIARRLKDLLKYMLYDCSQDKVLLDDEIEFIKNYIGLEELRNSEDTVTIRFDVQGDTTGKMITPLLLINFVENAFKHGVKGGIGSVQVNIQLKVIEDLIILDVYNNKPSIQQAHSGLPLNRAGGIGIANVKRRLQIMYPNRHELSIREDPENFNVHLSIVL